MAIYDTSDERKLFVAIFNYELSVISFFLFDRDVISTCRLYLIVHQMRGSFLSPFLITNSRLSLFFSLTAMLFQLVDKENFQNKFNK